jgi:hypothetical protein
MRAGLDMTTKKYGRLSAIRQIPNPKQTGALWEFECDCGNIKVIKSQAVRLGLVVSCGCYSKELLIKNLTTHNCSRHPNFKTWQSMISRCTKETDKDYPSYGGRGIKVCDDWLDPNKFIADMGLKPTKKHTLDRIDNNGNYEPKNCRWASPLEQSHNKRNNRNLTAYGETLCMAEFSRKYNIPQTTIMRRLAKGMTAEQIIETPIRAIGETLTYNGITKKLNDWAKDLGLTRRSIKNRLLSGWEMKDIVNKPSRMQK